MTTDYRYRRLPPLQQANAAILAKAAGKPAVTGKIGCTTLPDLPIIALHRTAESGALALDTCANTTITKVS